MERMGPVRWLIIILAIISVIEIGLFIWVGYLTSPWWVVGIIFLSSIIGLALVRQQGMKTWHKLNALIRARQMPTDEILNGICILIGAILLITPGFLTDFVGFLLVIPRTRRPFKQLLEKLLKLFITKRLTIYRHW